MRRPYRTVALAISALALGIAQAQTPPSNPLAGGGPPGGAIGPSLGGGISAPLNGPANGLARPMPVRAPVTPVPEPSEWLMLLAGLGVVGVIARRSASRRRSDDR